MSHTKIATCCYCGTRAALVLRGDVRHELTCSACGAPLHNMKHLKADAGATGKKSTPKKRKADWAPDLTQATRHPVHHPVRSSKKKRKKSIGYRLFDEALDLLEDIFD
ncbi:hypothetical protein [Antarctobacter jejuensis]|uniref:hypothetical protein n=1 Tax=Antarctobacter jejuensis TaxID=1439938 RepID=UPI003FCFAE60